MASNIRRTGTRLRRDRSVLSDGAMHASNESTAAGTAFAISYVSELEAVAMQNLVVFTTLDQ